MSLSPFQYQGSVAACSHSNSAEQAARGNNDATYNLRRYLYDGIGVCTILRYFPVTQSMLLILAISASFKRPFACIHSAISHSHRCTSLWPLEVSNIFSCASSL